MEEARMAYDPEKTRANTSGNTSGGNPKPPVDPAKAKKIGSTVLVGGKK